jgi:hypothetical protein
VERNVLDREQEFPPWVHFRVLAPRRQKNVDRKDDEIRRHDPQRAANEKAFEAHRLTTVQRGEQLPADQVTAKDEEQIDSDPTPTMDATGHRKTHDAGVVNNDNDDGERPQKIEARLAFAISKTRINDLGK